MTKNLNRTQFTPDPESQNATLDIVFARPNDGTEKEKTKIMDKWKISFWVYLIVFFVLSVIFMFLISRLFPILGDDYSWASYISMIPAFILTYIFYSFVEKRESLSKALIIKVLRIINGGISLATFGSLPLLPIGLIIILVNSNGSLQELKMAIFAYLGLVLVVIVLTTILTWLNHTSPHEELKQSLDSLH